MKQQMLKERVELLGIAEVLGFPRLGMGTPNGRKWSVRAGQPSWEKFCAHGHTTRIVTALKNARILRDNGVIPYNPRLESMAVRTVDGKTEQRNMLDPEAQWEPVVSPVPASDLLDEIDLPPSKTRDTWVAPETVKVYPPGKRRKYPVRKNRAKD